MTDAARRAPIGERIKAAALHCGTAVLNVFRIARAGREMRRCDALHRAHPHDGPVRVGFIAQMPEVWDKQMGLFQTMLEDPRFEPGVLYVKPYDIVRQKITDDGSRDRDFYVSACGAEHVTDWFGDETPDLDQYDYLFYDRPYNHYLPEALQTTRAVSHARLCMINYGADDWEMPFLYTDFAMGIRLWFASNTHESVIHQAVFGRSRYHRVFDVGYPAFDLYHALDSVPGKNRILWTPRWSYDAEVGGSHFFEYVHQMIDFAKTHPVTLVMRPHPLMFDNLVSKGLMTEEEVRALKQRCAEAGIRFDANRVVADTFRETDILVSDYSSILGLFMATGKPVIYCPSGIPLNDECRQLTDAMYPAESWEALEQALNQLIAGEDPMKEKRRQAVSRTVLKKQHAAAAIADIIYRDYAG